jgi:hypothetical protein
MGGSAPAMAAQVADGYTLISAVHLKRLLDNEIDLLQIELERIMRDIRSDAMALEDIPAINARNRKIARLSSALQQIQMTKVKRRRGA